MTRQGCIHLSGEVRGGFQQQTGRLQRLYTRLQLVNCNLFSRIKASLSSELRKEKDFELKHAMDDLKRAEQLLKKIESKKMEKFQSNHLQSLRNQLHFNQNERSNFLQQLEIIDEEIECIQKIKRGDSKKETEKGNSSTVGAILFFFSNLVAKIDQIIREKEIEIADLRQQLKENQEEQNHAIHQCDSVESEVQEQKAGFTLCPDRDS